ncbi:RNA polymerase sigma factor [Frigoribacterium sp. 2-23]|uniref:RNA polymerase sigma factor n=1 Tax=Frigoribacterium sp. 2-23 TaxID=3415006 RepID=UPI003C6F7A61
MDDDDLTVAAADTVLLRRAVGGETDALSELFDRHATTVTRYAWTLAPRRDDAATIVQDTFVELWRAADRIAASASVLPWLLAAARDHAFAIRREVAADPTDELLHEVGDGSEDEARTRLRWVDEVIAGLGETDRRLCELCLVQGRPYPEAAAELGLSRRESPRQMRRRARQRKAVIDR